MPPKKRNVIKNEKIEKLLHKQKVKEKDSSQQRSFAQAAKHIVEVITKIMKGATIMSLLLLLTRISKR